ncbi:MAG: sigma-70 family RNA polymerase sigma factor [Thermoleophilia bacterium]|nr:sigma-70 family RNA polymerase sigma factor [Thermoleophilia bacterium]
MRSTIQPPIDAPPNEADAFARVLDAAWAPVLRLLRAALPAGADLDDAAAATFEVAWRRRADLPPADALVPWMLGVAVNVARNQQRGFARRERLHRKLRDVAPGDGAPSAHEELLAGDPGPATVALSHLSAADRELLSLHAFEDLDNADIASVLGIRVNTVAQRLTRARRRLVAELECPHDPNIGGSS